MHTLTLPRLGQTMEAGTILAWRVEEGDSFDVGDALYEVETEKSELEVEAKLPGTVAKLAAPEGQEVKVGALLAVIADPGEELDDDQIQSALGAVEERPEAAVEVAAPAANVPEQARAGGGGRAGRVRAMPRAKRLAAELGIELSAVSGTGPDGTVTEADVKVASGHVAVRERTPLRGLARAQAEQMRRSQFSQDVEVDAAGLQDRVRALRKEGILATITDLVIDAVVAAVAEVPALNSSPVDDAIVLYEPVNVSVAVGTETGLVVPVLRDCQARDLAVRVAGLSDMADRRTSRVSDTTGLVRRNHHRLQPRDGGCGDRCAAAQRAPGLHRVHRCHRGEAGRPEREG